MKKSLAILLSICLVLTTIYGCFTISAAADEVENLWDVSGAPDQSGMSYWGDGDFFGEGSGNNNYLFGQNGETDTTAKFNPSSYGWRGYGLAANANQRVARYDGNFVHDAANSGVPSGKAACGLMVQLKYAKRAVSRQIELEAGKTYTLSFWFKGYVKGFDVKALDQIYNYHVASGDSVIDSISASVTSTTSAYADITGSTWEYVTVQFTLPSDKSVANFILYEGTDNNSEAAFDDFLLVEYVPEPTNLWDVDGAPDQSGMSYWNDGDFFGEGSGNNNYLFGQNGENDTTAKFTASSYGWRGYGLAANANQRVARYDGNYVHNSTASLQCGLMVQLKYAQRAVSRQVQLEAGKSYTLSFWFKGYVVGFDVKALDQIYNYHVGSGDSIITSMSADVNTTGHAYSDITGSTWEYITVAFTMPSDKSVANFILHEGNNNNTDAAFDDFLLVEAEATEPEEPGLDLTNHWAVEGAPDQCTMSYWNDPAGSFAGEDGGNYNYILGESKGKISPYGWRGYGLAANANQRAGRLSDSGGVYYHHNPTQALDCAFVVQLVDSTTTRGVSRQVQLTAGKSYTFNFYFKGVVQGFDITALSSIQNTHQSGGTSIITSMDYNLAATGQSFSDVTANTWAYVTVTFTMPSDKSVANFILGEGKACHAAYDDFSLVESAAVVANLFTDGDFEGFNTGSDSANAHYVYDTANQGNKGWRSKGTGMGVNGQRSAKWDGGGHNSSNSFAIQLWYEDRGVARQLELSDESSYYFSFYYKGILPSAVKVFARQTVQNGDNGKTVIADETFWKGTNIATMTVDTTQEAADWTLVEGMFTLPAGFPVANIVLGYGHTDKDTIGFIDDFELYEATDYAMVKTGLTVNGLQPYPSFSGGNTATADQSFVNKGDDVTLTATVASGYTFQGWYNGEQLVSSNLVCNVTVTDDITYTAKFTYSGTLNYWDGGDMETLANKYSYLGNNVANGYNEDGWLTANTGNSAGTTRAEADATTFHGGEYSLKLGFAGAVRALGRRFKLQNGHTYKLTFWAYGSENGFGIYNHDSATTPFICDNKDWGIMANKANSYEIIRTHAKGKDGSSNAWTQYSACFTLTEGDYVDIAWCTISGEYYIDDVVLVDHTHTWGSLVAETDSTCTTEGAVAHYECTDCPTGLCGVGTSAGVATNWKYLNKELLPHTLSYHAAQAGSCDEDSSIAHYSCDVCGKLFADAEGTEELSSSDVFTTAPGHTYDNEIGSSDYTAGVARTCTTDGYEGYFTCQTCGQLFDEDGNKIDAPIVLPKYHSAEGATVHKATVPSYSSEGNVTYYQCPNSSCVNGTKKYSLDPDFTTTYTKKQAESAAELACLADEGEMPLEYGGLTLNGEIGFNLFVDEIENYQDAYGITEASIEIYGIDAFDENGDFIPGSTPVATLDGNYPGTEGEGAFANFYTPTTPITVRADQMNDKLAIMLFDTSSGDKEIVEDFHDQGVLEISAMDILKQYIDTFENDSQVGAAEITQLSKACVTYGGYATSYFNKTAYADPGNTPSNLPYDLNISTVTQEVVDADRKSVV